jgi:adenylate kinase family enzyme
VHLDKLFWTVGWVERDKMEFLRDLDAALQGDAWIIDGNYSGTLARRLELCDLVVYLDIPRVRCLLGIVRRVLANYGTTRPDMGEGCPERFDLEFLRYVWDFERDHGARQKALIAGSGKPVIFVRDRREIEGVIEKVAGM